uniref:Uncharacterized protein n=1 Tax=Timema poppense TaxID=170557 RepID=A0A7R9CL05_TIMPO|nr:unnamed protein product [Timema poppensis]
MGTACTTPSVAEWSEALLSPIDKTANSEIRIQISIGYTEECFMNFLQSRNPVGAVDKPTYTPFTTHGLRRHSRSRLDCCWYGDWGSNPGLVYCRTQNMDFTILSVRVSLATDLKRFVWVFFVCLSLATDLKRFVCLSVPGHRSETITPELIETFQLGYTSLSDRVRRSNKHGPHQASARVASTSRLWRRRAELRLSWVDSRQDIYKGNISIRLVLFRVIKYTLKMSGQRKKNEREGLERGEAFNHQLLENSIPGYKHKLDCCRKSDRLKLLVKNFLAVVKKWWAEAKDSAGPMGPAGIGLGTPDLE